MIHPSRFILGAVLTASAALITFAGLEAQVPRRPVLAHAGQGDLDRLLFRNVGVAAQSPAQAVWVPYLNNPIISGKNLYAPSLVEMGEGWYLYSGGWRDAKDENDRIYLNGTNDPTLRGGFTPTNAVIDHGFYVHACDPSVVRVGDKTWVMALTVYKDRDWIAISVSDNGVKWSPNTFVDRSHEVRFLKGNVTEAARPALLFDAAKNRWEMYFDAKVDGKRGYYLAYCDDQMPRDFVIQGPVTDGAWADGEVKKIGGRYVAAYRRPETQDFPWVIRWAESKDGRSFTERGVLLEPDPLNGYDDMGVTNPGFAVDGKGVLRALVFGGTSTKTVNNHKLGVAYPQIASEAFSGTVMHGHRQALDPTNQVVATYQHKTVDRVRLIAPGGAVAGELGGSFPKGAIFDWRE